ncbi:MAG: hypothetical protein KTR31_01655 [Myxococcales bacterium]|nr:hypothetical protein [Myxococcales bacterium]
MTARSVATWLGIAVLILLASQARFTSSLDRVFPTDAARALQLADSLRIAGILRFEVDGSEASPDELRDAVIELTKALDDFDGIEDVRGVLTAEDLAAVRSVATDHATALVSAEDLRERTSPQGMQRALLGAIGLLSGPGGGLVEDQVRSDPLGIETLALDALRAGGGRGQVRGGILLDTSGTHALVLAQTQRTIQQIGPDDPWVQQLDDLLAAQPLPVQWLGGARYASETATAIRSDVRRAVVVGTGALVLFLLVGLRSLRPMVGALVAMAVAIAGSLAGAALVGPVHGIQLAFVGPLAGLAADYWIHLYVCAARRTPPDADRPQRQRAAEEALTQLRAPLRLAAGSTGLAFAILTVSQLPMVRGLGVMGLCTIATAYLSVRLAGPALFGWVGAHEPPHAPHPRHGFTLPVLAAVAALAMLATGSSFDTDPRNLLARSVALEQAEAGFAQRWADSRRQGLVVVQGDDAGAVLDRAAAVQQAISALGIATPVGPATWLPGPATAALRRAALPPPHELDRRLTLAADTVGFVSFPGAGQRLHDRARPLPLDAWEGTLVGDVVGRHLRTTDEGHTALITVPLATPDMAFAIADTVAATDADARWVDTSSVAQHGLQTVVAEFARYAGVAVGLVAILLIAHLRDPAKVALTLAPAAAGLLAAAGGSVLLSTPWNAVSVSLCMLLVGLAFDYGIFCAVTQDPGSARRAVVLGALTTLAGFAGLLAAEAPVLRSVGIAMGFGVTAAAAVALVVVPALLSEAPWPGRRALPWLGRLAWLALVGVHLDLLLVTASSFRLPDPDATAPPHELQGTPGNQRFGPQRLVRREGVWLLSTEGGAYESGYGAGALTRELRVRLEDELFHAFHTAVPHPAARWLITRASMVVGATLPQAIDPEHLLEIQGDVDATPKRFAFRGPPYTRKVYYHAIHDIGQALVDTPLLACSGFMAGGSATADGSWLLARNFDFDGGVAFDRDKVIWVHQPDEGHAFVSLAFSGLVGSVSGLNAEGLAVAIQAGGSDAPIRTGTPMTLIVRQILQTASSLDEAEAVLRSRSGFVSENVMVVDGAAGEAALFEVSPDRVERLDVDGHLAVTNHFRHEAFADDATNLDRMATITTVPRLQRLEELLQRRLGRLDMPAAVQILKDRRGLGDAALPRGHRHALDADLATHSIVIDATQQTLWISRYPHVAAGFVEVRLADLLRGELAPVEVVAPDDDADRAFATRQGRTLLRQARRARTAAEALELGQQALALMPDHPEALVEVGVALHRLDRTSEAEPLLRQALATPPEYAHQVHTIEELLP